MRAHFEPPAGLLKLRNASLVVGVAGAVACAVFQGVFPAEFYPAYLVAFLFWLGISVGSLGIALIHHLTGGAWGYSIRRILEAAYGTLPLLAILFIPLAMGLKHLYDWSDPAHVSSDAILQRKAAYLNDSAFLIRSAAYFVVWILLGVIASGLTSGTEPRKELRRRRALARLAGPALILWCLSVTFAAVDWVMSLEPHWYSSMYGVLFMAANGVSGLSFAIVIGVAFRHADPWSSLLAPGRLHDLGNLLLAFVMFWAYVSFSQYLIIWSGNLPEETPWYLARGSGGWEIVAQALIVLHFLMPFLVLLIRQTKREPLRLLPVAVLLLAMRFVDLTWLVMPAFSPGKFSISWLNFVTPLGIGGLWLAMFAWRLPRRAALPVFDAPPSEDVAE